MTSRAHRSFKSGVFNPQPGSITSEIYNTASTSVSLVLPARRAGDRLIIFINRSSASSDAIATPASITALETSSLTGSASNFCRAYYHDVTKQNEGINTVTFTGGTSTLSTSLIIKITGSDLTIVPVANGVAQGSNTTTVDPASLTGPESGAIQRTIYIAYVGTSNQDVTLGTSPAVTVFPTGYTNTGTSTTTDVSASNGCGQGWGIKIVTSAGSDNPSAWTYCPTGTGRAFAINVAVKAVVG